MIYFQTFPVPTADTLFLLVLSILALESAHSIRFLYKHFLSGITKKSLNVFYYACSYTHADYSRFMNVTAKTAMKLIPDSLKASPVFLCVDDTMVPKFGTRFENVSKLFDHAAHNGSNYLNGHCFVSIMLCVPVRNNGKNSYLSIPLGYRMWQKKESKLELTASMIRQVMPEFHGKEHVIILCDSWYTKQNLVSIVDEYPNLDLIGNARIDSVMYELAPARTGRRGRPVKHGRRLSVENDFTFSNEKWVDTIQVSAGLSPEFSVAVKFLPMSLPRAKKMVQSDCFSAPFFQKICRLCVLLWKKMYLTRPKLTGKNISLCSYTHYAGTLKPAIMSRKLSGLCELYGAQLQRH